MNIVILTCFRFTMLYFASIKHLNKKYLYLLTTTKYQTNN